MIVEDWRDADRDTVAALFTAEEERWRRLLGWDTQASWAVVEEGRSRGYVPGWLLRDGRGDVRGWTFYILHDGELQIGGLTAARATDLRLLLDRVLDSPEASLASAVSAFVFPAPPSLTSAFTRRRFAVRPSLYLSRALDADAEAAPAALSGLRIRPFGDRDVFPAVRLLAQAYEGTPGAECFAPHGRLDEWVRYVRQLIDSPACGRWLPASSFVADDPADGRLAGLVMATTLSGETAHIAQLVVSRAVRGLGVGDALVSRACLSARAAGHRAMTLMVDNENLPARRLYARQQFAERSEFVYARRRGQVRAVLPAGARKAG
jgi:ribosomal protein S18 acetylase RimI-like enzyme